MEEPDKTSSKSKGDEGEERAARFLMDKGFEILFTQWKFYRYEIDIIASNEVNIVFVEVKTRYSSAFGMPWEAVNQSKRKRICQSADAFLQTIDTELEPRFDIISIIIQGQNVTIEHIEDAFHPMA
jgi:putative endonuclease